MKGLSVNKSVTLHDDLGIFVTITYKKDFNLSKWVNENLNEEVIKEWIKNQKY